MGKMKPYKKLIIILVVAVLLVTVGLVLFFVLQGRQQSTTELSTAQSAAVERGDINNAIEGTGSLEIADSSVVQMPKGLVIEKIKVQNGQAVKSGDVIATVTEASVASELLTVREQIDDVEEKIDNLDDDKTSDTDSVEYLEKLVLEAGLVELQSNEKLLNEIRESGSIVAPTSGTIADLKIVEGSSVESAVNNSSNSNSSNTNGASFMSTASSATGIMKLSTAEPIVAPEAETAGAPTAEPTPMPTSITTIGVNELNIVAPKTGAIPQNRIEPIEGANYTGTITWDNSDKTFNAGVSYTATIVLTANENHTFNNDILVEIANTQLINWSVYNAGEAKNSLRIVAKYEATTTITEGGDKPSEGKEPTPSVEPEKGGTSGTGGGTTPETGGTGSGGSTGNTGNTGAMGSSTSGNSQNQTTPSTSTDTTAGSSNSGSNMTTTSANSLLTTIATIGNNEVVEVNINVDELDILTVAEGQGATVTLDAIEGETFEGVVTAISSEASQGDSSVKYTVGIEMPKTDHMLIGMSAAATINVEEVKGVLTIPVNALQESGERIFVYTSTDASGNLSGEVDVTTGLSDGSQVEILGGLNEGDTVYYTRVTNSNSNNSFGGNGMPSFNGGMPNVNGGGMPIGRVSIGGR